MLNLLVRQVFAFETQKALALYMPAFSFFRNSGIRGCGFARQYWGGRLVRRLRNYRTDAPAGPISGIPFADQF